MSTDLKYVNHWVDKHGWDQLSWRDSYGGGVWTAIAPPTHVLELIRDATQSKDNQQSGLRASLLESSLLPIRTGVTLSTAMLALETRLAELPAVQHARGSLWAVAVHELYEDYREQLKRYALDRSLGLDQGRAAPRGPCVEPAIGGAIEWDSASAPSSPARLGLPTPRAARDEQNHDVVRSLAARLQAQFRVPCVALPANATRSGRLVHVERCSDHVSLAALLTESHVHLVSVASRPDLPQHVGHELTVQSAAGRVRIMPFTPSEQLRLPQRSPREPELTR